MAKMHKISTKWGVTEGSLKITVKAVDAEKGGAILHAFERVVNIPEVFGEGYEALNEIGQEAIGFGVYTVLRNATGSAETGQEAEEAIDRRIAAWDAGDWGAARESSAVPFSANTSIAKAVEAATKGAQSAADAAAKLSAMAEELVKSNFEGIEGFADLDPKDRAKVRKVTQDKVLDSRPAIKAEYLAIEAAKQQEALARKAAAAAKAKEELSGADGEVEGI